MKRRIISLLLALCMVTMGMASVGFTVSAQDVGTASTSEDYGLPQNCKDGNILHCFNWTLNDIKNELPNIAAAGFTSVQTSPLQPHNASGTWYWLYQPTDSTIGNELGVDTDLIGTFAALDDLLDKILPRKKLREYGVEESRLPYYVDKVFETQQRLLVANCVPMTKEQFIEIYRKAY